MALFAPFAHLSFAVCYTIITGRALAAWGSVNQAIVIFVLALILRVKLEMTPPTILGVIILSGTCFSSLSIDFGY